MEIYDDEYRDLERAIFRSKFNDEGLMEFVILLQDMVESQDNTLLIRHLTEACQSESICMQRNAERELGEKMARMFKAIFYPKPDEVFAEYNKGTLTEESYGGTS